MTEKNGSIKYDFKGIGFSKVGHFKEVRSKINELEKLNIELATRHNRLEAIINSISDGMTILDSNLNITFVNKLQTALFPEGPLVGRPCYEALYRRSSSCRNCPALRTLETQEIYRGEVIMKAGPFVGHYYEWTISPIVNPFGKVSEIVLLMRDVTQRKEYEHNLLQADRMAAVGLLAASIAHEINNPLASIAGFAEGLLKRLGSLRAQLDDAKAEAFQEYLEIILSESYRCKDIVQNLLQYSRKSVDEPEILSIEQIVNETVSLLRQHAKDHKIRITVKSMLAAGLGNVFGKESQLKHLFLNIFNLAFRAMGNGGEIVTTQRNSGNLVEVSISAQTERSFSRQWEDLVNTTCAPDGTSRESPINLSVCYTIMRNHSGQLTFVREGDRKATFRLMFPASMLEHSRECSESSSRAKAHSKM